MAQTPEILPVLIGADMNCYSVARAFHEAVSYTHLPGAGRKACFVGAGGDLENRQGARLRRTEDFVAAPAGNVTDLPVQIKKGGCGPLFVCVYAIWNR